MTRGDSLVVAVLAVFLLVRLARDVEATGPLPGMENAGVAPDEMAAGGKAAPETRATGGEA